MNRRSVRSRLLRAKIGSALGEADRSCGVGDRHLGWYRSVEVDLVRVEVESGCEAVQRIRSVECVLGVVQQAIHLVSGTSDGEEDAGQNEDALGSTAGVSRLLVQSLAVVPRRVFRQAHREHRVGESSCGLDSSIGPTRLEQHRSALPGTR